jgi:G3E family GTPase
LINNIEGFTSVSYETFEPFSLRKFQYFLDNQISQNVFRAKGILWFMESERKHIFHLSGKRFSLDDEEWTKERSNKIVLIGKNLDHKTIKKQLSSCRFNSD